MVLISLGRILRQRSWAKGDRFLHPAPTSRDTIPEDQGHLPTNKYGRFFFSRF